MAGTPERTEPAGAPFLAVDIGNTRIHWGAFDAGELKEHGDLRSDGDPESLAASLLDNRAGTPVVACSVVPTLTSRLGSALASAGSRAVFLDHRNLRGLDVRYPHPAELGPDRLANALGGLFHGPPPFVVIDMGTAVTFDLVTRSGGYEGGVIAPGVALLSDYLAERTALLPRIDLTGEPSRAAFGTSTLEAMEIGCRRGFVGMIREILGDCIGAAREIDGVDPHILATGGSLSLFQGTWLATLPADPHLTLRGLREAARFLLWR